MLKRALLVIALAVPAGAQFGPGGGMQPMGGPGGPQPGPEKKEEEGPAEAAPEAPGQQPALEPLPEWPGQREKQLQFFQLDGYLRGRASLYHNLSLGIPQLPSGPVPPFYVPYSEFGAPNPGNPSAPGNPASCAARTGQTCRTDNLTSADMRLRLEPTINIGDKVRVRAQIDVFDNMVLGSTPEGFFLNGLSPSQNASLAAFSRTQGPPEAGRNSIESAIRVKRAWAEVGIPIGELRFGRMPSHWGTGMLVNGGDCFDCDYGQNADRVMFTAGGERLRHYFLTLQWDWVATGPTTRLLTANQLSGPAYNADPLDDVSQWGIALGRKHTDREIRERVQRGDVVINYGAYVTYRKQEWDLTNSPGANMAGGALNGTTSGALSAALVPRDAWAVLPDLWFRLDYGKLHLEAEAALLGGKINSFSDQLKTQTQPLDILEFGGVAHADYKLLHDALHLALDVGFASGDAAEDQNGRIHFATAQRLPVGNRISNFMFDPDFHVDLILFRRILGTVSNATYVKPSIAYDLIQDPLNRNNLSAKVDVIYSLANVPVAYPGNSANLGLEIDAHVMYENRKEGFYAGLAYGVLFPFAALNFRSDIFGTRFGHDAEAAQTLQARLVVKF